jgi:branched-chain amino acid transport system substrate-binding protein
MATRIARFDGGRQISAPVQIVPVSVPDASEIAAGRVFEIEPGRYARLQRVAFAGVFVNEIPRMDLARSSFNADFYLWLRFAREAGPGGADPTDIVFPTMMSGGFERRNPVRQREMPDGTEYWLWRVQGEFRNDFDLRRFPFDIQRLSLTFFNARRAMDEIVYALDYRADATDRGSLIGATPSGSSLGAGGLGVAMAAQPARGANPADAISIASPLAFRNLSQWDARSAHSRREVLVTDSPLGDPTRVGPESRLELSGFLVDVEVQRRALSILAKSLLPLVLMTLMMYAALFFPDVLIKEKVTVVVTAALSGAVLLTSIHDQLGAVGYTIAVEYAFYVFFALALLCTVSILSVERLRAAGRRDVAAVAEVWTRHAYLIAVALTVISAASVYLGGSP